MNDDAPTQLEAGPAIPDFRLVQRIDRGAFGEVWLAQSLATARYRAVKVVYRDRLPSEQAYDTEFAGLKRFEEISREHEGFVDILHISRHDEARYFYYIMELADDLETGAEVNETTYAPRTLARELAKRRRLPPVECVKIGLALTSALGELHGRSLVHRDIKPANVLFVRGAPKVGDIGLVTETRREPATLLGTPAYMDGQSHGTAQGDLYSLGKVLYVMATGRRPEEWPAGPEETDHLEDPDGFRDLEHIYRKACQDDRAQRYRSATEIHQQLLVLRAGRSVRRLQQLERLETGLRRYGLLLFGLIVLATLAVFQWDQRRRQAAELNQRKVGSYVAYGTRAMEEHDMLGALPWFTEALALEQTSPAQQEAHRLRIGTILQNSPTIIQVWFHERDFDRATFAQENEILTRGGKRWEKWGILDLATGQPLFPLFGNGGEHETAAINPTAGLAVTTDYSTTVRLWDFKTGEATKNLTYHTNIYGGTLSHDGQWVAAAAFDYTGVVWNTSNGQTNTILIGHRKPLGSIAFSPDGRRLVTGDGDGRTIVWERGSGRRLQTFSRNNFQVFQAAFSPDGRRVATASLDRSCRVWDSETGREVLPPLLHEDGVQSVEFSADGQQLVTGGLDFSVRIWNAQTGKLLHLLRHNAKLAYAAFSPNGRLMVTTTHDGVVRVWDLRQSPVADAPPPIAVSANGGRFLRRQDRRLQVVEATGGRVAAVVSVDGASLPQAWLDGRGERALVATTPMSGLESNRMEVALWRFANPRQPMRTITLMPAQSNLALSAPGNYWAAFGNDRLTVWESSSGRELLTLTQGVRCATFDPSGRRLAVASSNQVRVWDLTTARTPMVRAGPHHADVGSVEWSHDGRFFVTGCWDTSFDQESAQVWDAITGRPAGAPLHHRDGVIFAAFSPDDRRVITCSEDFTAMIWEPRTGQRLTPPLRHKHQVLHAAFSQDGRWVATGCRDHTARLWDAASGEPLSPPLLHSDEVQYVQFVNNSQALFTRTRRGDTYLWALLRDRRPVSDLVLIASLLSAQQSQPTGLMIPQSTTTLHAIWDSLHSRYPGDFAFGQR